MQILTKREFIITVGNNYKRKRMDLTAAAIATLISSSIATIITLFINKKNSINKLNEQLDDIIKIAIQYPYLESPQFTNTWNDNKTSFDDKYLRYENYCTLVFNYMERICQYYNHNEEKIDSHLNLKNWIRIHKQCWENPSTPFSNTDSYSSDFKQILNKYIK